MLGNKQCIDSLDVAKRAADIIFRASEGQEPYRSKDEIMLTMKLLNDIVNSCVAPSNIAEAFNVAVNGRK